MLVVLALALLWGLAFAGYTVSTGLEAKNAQAAQALTMPVFLLVFLSPIFRTQGPALGVDAGRRDGQSGHYLLEAMRSLTVEGWQAGPLLQGFAVAAALAVAMLARSTNVARRATSPS